MNWGSVVPTALLMATISLTYSSLNPLICPAAAVYFFLGLIVYKYNLMFVYSKPFETGGVMWGIIVTRMLVACIIYQVRDVCHNPQWAPIATLRCIISSVWRGVVLALVVERVGLAV